MCNTFYHIWDFALCHSLSWMTKDVITLQMGVVQRKFVHVFVGVSISFVMNIPLTYFSYYFLFLPSSFLMFAAWLSFFPHHWCWINQFTGKGFVNGYLVISIFICFMSWVLLFASLLVQTTNLWGGRGFYMYMYISYESFRFIHIFVYFWRDCWPRERL